MSKFMVIHNSLSSYQISAGEEMDVAGPAFKMRNWRRTPGFQLRLFLAGASLFRAARQPRR